MAVTVDVRVEGLNALRRKLGKPPLHAEPLRAALTGLGALLLDNVRQRAPVRTGRMKSTLRTAVSGAAVPRWVAVRGNATRRRFRFGWALDNSNRIQYRYRQGAHRGQRTIRWFTFAVKAVAPRIGGALATAARQIESLFGGR